MYESSFFTFDGVSSEDMGVVMINPGSGLYKEPFMAARKIVETSVAGRDTPYFTGVDSSPLSMSVTIFIEKWQDKRNLRAVARWLNQKTYKPFWVEDAPDRIADVIFDGAGQLVHNGCKEGYVTLNMRCESTMFRSQTKYYKKEVRGAHFVNINNDGDESFAPYLTIEKIGNGNVTLKLTLEEKEITTFTIENMLDGEIAYVDCINETIRSSYHENERYLFDLVKGAYPTFQLGNIYDQESSTRIDFVGDFNITMEYEIPYLIAE